MTIGTARGARSPYERRDGQRVSVHDIQQAKRQGERFVMLTAYDTLVAGIFDRVKLEGGRQVTERLEIPTIGAGPQLPLTRRPSGEYKARHRDGAG
jgi:hypothetical protein